MVTTFYPPYHFGGDAIYVRALSRALVERGHTVEVVHCEDAYLVSGNELDPSPGSPDDGIVVHRLKSRFGPLSPLITQQTGHPGLKAGALRAIFKRGFDVVNFHNISLVGGPGILGFSDAPVTLYTLHEHWLLCPTHIFWKNRSKACDVKQCIRCSIRSGIPPQWWRYTGLIENAIAHVDAFLAPSEFTAALHRESGIGPVTVLPLFSTLDPPAHGSDIALPRPRFLCVGRVTASKGILPLLERFAALPEYDITVVGDGDLRARLEQQFAQFPNIRFLGLIPQSELTVLYRHATALVFPSLAPETFGLSIVEAFACGTPAIVRDAGGSRELVDATGGGIVYRTDDELVQALRQLAGDRALRVQLGQRARAGFERRYTQKHHVDAYLECIDMIRQNKTVAVR
ncbi:MAG: glycosyltransferase family 4 protein [Betaproteobacteria bacterium]